MVVMKVRKVLMRMTRRSMIRRKALLGLVVSTGLWMQGHSARAQTLQPMGASPPQSITAQPLPAALVNQNAYILGPGDQVHLTLLDPGVQNLNGTLEILNDGTASLAMLGSVALEGLTVDQATAWLQSLYNQYLLRPALNLRVVSPRPVQVSVVGEVENPGLYSLSLGETSQAEGIGVLNPGLPTLVAAVQKAGGLTLNADLTNVQLQRRLPGDTRQLRETDINLKTLLQLGDKSQNPFLFDGDTIIVGRAATLDREVMELAASNLSPQSISVNVVGEVVSPGRQQLEANAPLMKAILAAGGPETWRAKQSNIELVRINRNGTATRQLFRLNYSEGVNPVSNPPLRNGDTVIVNRSNYAVVTDALDAVTQPLSSLVNAWALVDLIQNTNQ